MVHIFFVVLAAKNDLDSLAQSKYEFCHLLFWPGILQTSRMENLQLCSSPSQMFAGIQVTLLVAATDFRREVQQNVSKIMLTQCSQSFRFVNPFFFNHSYFPSFVSQTYHNCSCFTTEDSYAEDGRCTPDCSMFPLFAISTFTLIFCTFMNNVPMLSATFRQVFCFMPYIFRSSHRKHSVHSPPPFCRGRGGLSFKLNFLKGGA